MITTLPVRRVSPYLGRLFGDQKEIDSFIFEAMGDLQDVDFDTVIGTGVSGALSVPLLARAMGKSWAIVRKEQESSHGLYEVEGEIGSRWILVDDQISTGRTLERVQEAIDRACEQHWHNAGFVGAWLYALHEGFVPPSLIPDLIDW